MILFKFKEKKETRLNYPCEKFKWVMEIYVYNNILYLQFTNQFKFKNNEEWYDSLLIRGISVSKNFKLKYDKFYYDGFHHSLSIGWITFYWGN